MSDIKKLVSEMIKILKNHRLQSSESILSLINFAFSGSLGILSNFRPYDFNHLKLATTYKIQNEKVCKAYKVISAYTVSDTLLNDLLDICGNLSIDEWKSVLEYIFENEYISQLKEHIETPLPINKLCMEILNPISGSFYDGVAGICSTVIEAWKKSNENISVYTQEINVINHAVSVLRLFSLGIDCENVMCGDTLKSPCFTENEYQLKQFDYSVMFPPMGAVIQNTDEFVYWDEYRRFTDSFSKNTPADWFFVQHMYASLNENGKGIIALPSGMLFNAVLSKMRSWALEHNIIECIISLPSTVLPYTNTPLSLLIINKKKNTDGIFFIQADSLFTKYKSVRWKNQLLLDDDMIKEIADIYFNKAEIEGVSKMTAVDFEEAVLLPSRYVTNSYIETEFGNIHIDNKATKKWMKLGDIATFYRGVNVSTSLKKDDYGDYKLINYTDVQKGKLLVDNLDSYDATRKINAKNSLVKKDDLIISCKGAAIKLCVIPPNTEDTLLSINFIGIRIDNQNYDVQFLKEYMESPVAQNYLKNMQVGTSIVTLATRDLEKLPVPPVSPEYQKKYTNQFKKKEKEINDKINELQKQLKQEKWDFYMNIGLEEIMKEG